MTLQPQTLGSTDRVSISRRDARTQLHAIPGQLPARFPGAAAVSAAGRISGVPCRTAGRISDLHRHRDITTFSVTDATASIAVRVADNTDPHGVLTLLHDGDIVGIDGFLGVGAPPVLFATTVVVLTKSLAENPVTPLTDTTGPQHRYGPANQPGRGMSLPLRAGIIQSIRSLLGARGYLEVDTPVLLPYGDLNEVTPFTTTDATNRELYLRCCHEDRLKRLLIGGFTHVFEMGKSFRKEQHSWKHNPEFLQLECMAAYADHTDMLALAADVLQATWHRAGGTTTRFLGGRTIDLAGPLRTVTVREAIDQYAGIDIGEVPDVEYLRSACKDRGVEVPAGYHEEYNLIALLIDTFVEPNLLEPTALMRHPVNSNYYARRCPDNPHFIDRFEIYIGGVEIANGYALETDPIDYQARLEHSVTEYHARHLPLPARDGDDLVDAKIFGMPPCAVVGFGIDRLAMLATGSADIASVMWLDPRP